MNISSLKNISNALAESGLDALALNPGFSLLFASGLHFHLMERPTIVFFTADGQIAIVLPELEVAKLNNLPYDIKAFPYGENPKTWTKVFRNAIKHLDLDGKKVGVEPLAMRIFEYRYLQAAAPLTTFPDATETIASLRMIKGEKEINALRKAAEIAQNALEATLPMIKVGVSEKRIASELVSQLLKNGSESPLPFQPIVSGGPNSANPHATPTERKLQEGDLLVIDWGARYKDYVSDITRTFAIGKIDAEYRKIHEIVQKANAAGRAAAKPGLPAKVVDIAARKVIENTGYGEYFTHRTGHGIGMEGHEAPYMRDDNERILEVGMAFTVEPGIYLPNRNGVRVEDDLVITKDGAESLSTLPREIRVLG
ncbi:MAG: aminopeptidase P family protein [Anaerolineae bacterium]|jgi:Xaa-Pro dipeptidase|nr:aminopeptidase P family protein [Anaerolineae bacterium]MBT7075609.1 aminopeptidase P family protein [Anaerolineae bacterium]MBT7783757.1 aminopeptidase P family protein [Anaerolineae bacterium]